MSQKYRRYNTFQPLVLAASVAIGMMVGFKMNDISDGSAWQWVDDKEQKFGEGRVEQFLRFVEHKYVDSIDTEELTEEAVRAILAKLDPYSYYLSPQEVKGIEEDMNGSYVGIGVENYFLHDTIQVSRVIPGSPADKAGMKIFDQLIAIDDISVAGQGMAYEEIRDMLSRSVGEKIKVHILRGGAPLTLDIEIQNVSVSTVSSHHLPEIETAYIRIFKFGTHTYRDFMKEVEVLFGEKKARHLILDLRDNMGGYLPEAIHILCQIFEEKDKLLMYTKGKNDRKYEYKSTGKRFFPIDKVYVLIDENSASASEIVAGAIQDWDRGIIIGRRSFGKGMVQEQYALKNGGAVRLTVSRYYTPSGRSVQKPLTDREHFDNELDDRYVSGEIFYRDSLKTDSRDTFFTKVLHRPIFGHGGITPDIFMALPEFLNDKESFRIRHVIPLYIHHLSQDPSTEMPASYAALQAWKIPEDFYFGFVAFAEKHYNEKLFWPQILNYEPIFREETASQNFSEEELWKYQQNEDDMLKTSVEAATRQRIPSDLKNE